MLLKFNIINIEIRYILQIWRNQIIIKYKIYSYSYIYKSKVSNIIKKKDLFISFYIKKFNSFDNLPSHFFNLFWLYNCLIFEFYYILFRFFILEKSFLKFIKFSKAFIYLK